MTCKEYLKTCVNNHKAILATNFYNFETLKGLILAAKESDNPLMLQASESTLKYLGIKPAFSLAYAMLKEYGVTGWIHLDHGSSIEIAQRCLDAGFDSVMIDDSENSIEGNIETTKKVVKIAEEYGANVEAELGYIAKLGQGQTIEPTSTDQAKRFAEETGIDALAVAIGNAHGFYKEKPNLRFDRLKEIREKTTCALVLHGSSGIPEEQLQKAIHLGINKINLATETKNTFMLKLREELKNNDDIDLRKVFPPVIGSVKNLILKKLELIHIK